jgi:hypothetical protein
MDLNLARQLASQLTEALKPNRLVLPTESLQQALNESQAGDTIELIPGQRYVGELSFPPRSKQVTLTTQGYLPNRRVLPSDAPNLATLAGGPLTFAASSNWKIDGVSIEPTAGSNEAVVIQDSVGVHLDRVLLVGTGGIKRGIRGNGQNISLTRSYVANIWRTGQDSQAFCAWDGAGPYTLVDNYLEAGSENVMFGGADSKSVERIPSDILIDGNTFFKPLTWKVPGTYAVKNLLEFKVGKRVTVRNNIFTNNWTDAQNGYAILLKSVNQGGTAPWSVLEDVEIYNNTITGVENGFNILGVSADQPGGKTTRINIHDNVLTVSGTAFQLGGKAGVVSVVNNSLVHGGNLVTLYGTYAAESFTFTGNKYKNVPYGIKGDATGSGLPSLTKFCLAFTYENNVVW